MAIGVYCVKCKHKELEPKFDKWPCKDCFDGDRSEPITNYDLLISKTQEELAVICEAGCPPNHNCPPMAREEIGLRSSCQKCWLDWLKSPVEPGEVDNGT